MVMTIAERLAGRFEVKHRFMDIRGIDLTEACSKAGGSLSTSGPEEPWFDHWDFPDGSSIHNQDKEWSVSDDR